MAVGTYIERARNEIAQRAVKGDNDYLLFVDSDIVFDVDDLFKLKDALDEDPKIGAIAALYVYRDETLRPVAQWISEVDGQRKWFSGWDCLNRTVENMKADKVDDVEVFGTGFMLIRTQALKDIGEPYFMTQTDLETGGFTGEDVLFGQRIRDKGWRACVHFGVQVGHIGRAAFYPKDLLSVKVPDSEEEIEASGMMEQRDVI